jgi:hypothetical protein
MKTLSIIWAIILMTSPLLSQKNPTVLTSNLNMSKSNINRVIYPPTLMSQENAQLMLNELDKSGHMEAAALKMWLAANFRRFNVDTSLVRQISIYQGQKFKDCIACKEQCGGPCAEELASGCLCLTTAKSGIRRKPGEPLFNIIYLSSEVVSDSLVFERMANTLKTRSKPAVKQMN